MNRLQSYGIILLFLGATPGKHFWLSAAEFSVGAFILMLGAKK